jgi:hypothetical protein
MLVDLLQRLAEMRNLMRLTAIWLGDLRRHRSHPTEDFLAMLYLLLGC